MRHLTFKLERWLASKELTVCEELTRQGILSRCQLNRERIYCSKHVPQGYRVIYRICIMPIVKLMQVSPWITQIISKIAWKVWLTKSLNKKKYVNKR